MENTAGKVRGFSRDLASIGAHELVCAMFESREQQIEAARLFFEVGLSSGEQCFYFAEDPQLHSALAAALKTHIPLDRTPASGDSAFQSF